MIKSVIFSAICTFLSVFFAGVIIDNIEQSYLFPVETVLIVMLLISGTVFGFLFSKEKSQIILVSSLSILFGFLLFIGYFFIMLQIFGK